VRPACRIALHSKPPSQGHSSNAGIPCTHLGSKIRFHQICLAGNETRTPAEYTRSLSRSGLKWGSAARPRSTITSTFTEVKAAAESRRIAFEEAVRRLPGIARIRRFRQPGCEDTSTWGGRHWPLLDVLSPGNSAARRGLSVDKLDAITPRVFGAKALYSRSRFVIDHHRTAGY
jgi:hypothetical protein